MFFHLKKSYYYLNNGLSASIRICKHPSIRSGLRLYYFLFRTEIYVSNGGGDEKVKKSNLGGGDARARAFFFFSPFSPRLFKLGYVGPF